MDSEELYNEIEENTSKYMNETSWGEVDMGTVYDRLTMFERDAKETCETIMMVFKDSPRRDNIMRGVVLAHKGIASLYAFEVSTNGMKP